MIPVLKYPGAKWSLSRWIISNFPYGYEKMTYLEPYFGSGGVFFNKKRSKIETINDLDSNVVNLFKVIRECPEELASLIKFTPWAREEYKISYENTGDNLEDARRFIVRLWQAIGGKTSDITGWSNNIKPVDSGKGRWSKLDCCILETTKRLQSKKLNIVQIENMPAIELIQRYNKPYVFIYGDPPYILSTRSKRIYKHEMTEDDHIELLGILKQHKGPVMISGYDHEIYNSMLDGWIKKQHKANCEFGKKAIETLWMNYETDEQMVLF